MQEEKYILNVEVDKDNVKIKNKEKIHEREYKATKCVFTFTEDFDNLTKKAIFEAEDVIKEMPIISNECDIPEEVLQDGCLSCNLRVYGYDIEEVEGQTTIRLRYSPTYDTFPIWKGSFIPNAEQGEEITPTQFEQYTNALNQGLEAIEDKIEEADAVLENIDTAIEETNNLNLDVSKEGKVATVTLTKKDATTKVVTLSDGTSLMFNWDGTKLGIKTDEEAEYTYVDLQGVQGETGPMGAPFTIKKTYSSVAEMNADFNNMQLGDYVMIASTVEIEDNAKLYTRGEEQWIFISDFSGSQGIKGETGATPNIQIGSVISGNAPSVTRTGTNENPILNFVLEKGDKGDTGRTGQDGYTPVKGVDYYTEEEVQEIVNEITEKAEKDVNKANMVYNALPKVTGTGEEITLNNTAETPIKLELKPSELSQETTTGKQLFNKNDSSMIKDGYIGSNKLITASNNTKTLLIPCTENKTYTISKVATARFRAGYITTSYAVGVEVKDYHSVDNGTTITITAGADATYLVAFIYDVSLDTKTLTEILDSVMANEGSVAPYEPYTGGIPAPNPEFPMQIHTITGDNEITIANSDSTKSQVFSIPLGNLEYCKINNYSDEFIYNTTDTNLELNKWYLKKNIGKVVLDSSVTIQAISAFGNGYRAYFNVSGILQASVSNINLYSNYFYGDTSVFDTNYAKVGMMGAYKQTERVYIMTDQSTAQNLKNWFGTHNTDLYYPLATPTYTLLNDTLQEVLTNLYNYAYSYQNQTNISQTNDDLPITMNAEAVRDMSSIFDL